MVCMKFKSVESCLKVASSLKEMVLKPRFFVFENNTVIVTEYWAYNDIFDTIDHMQYRLL